MFHHVTRRDPGRTDADDSLTISTDARRIADD
jgi:hypothetical protein